MVTGCGKRTENTFALKISYLVVAFVERVFKTLVQRKRLIRYILININVNINVRIHDRWPRTVGYEK